MQVLARLNLKYLKPVTPAGHIRQGGRRKKSHSLKRRGGNWFDDLKRGAEQTFRGDFRAIGNEIMNPDSILRKDILSHLGGGRKGRKGRKGHKAHKRR